MTHDETEEGLPGQDSFLDIVANMVGILIILVMVVGVRASHVASLPSTGANQGDAATSADSGDAGPIKSQLEEAVREALSQRREVEGKLSRAQQMRREAELADAKRLELSMMRSQLEQEIEQRRDALDDEKKSEFDVQRQIAAAQIKLSDLTQEQLALLDAPTEVEEIESVPTPLATEVTGDEIHVRLKHRLLAVVPVKLLLAEVEQRGLGYLRRGLREKDSAADVYGPIAGFRMRLYLEVLTEGPPRSSPLHGPQRRTMVQMGEFLPASDELGQRVEQALLPDSPLMQLLRDRRLTHPALVVWAYPDSYDDLGVIKRSMWELGIPLAIRPLDMDQRIVFSSHGTKSSAQ